VDDGFGGLETDREHPKFPIIANGRAYATMAKRETKLEQLDVPDECYRPKANYPTRPGKAVVDEIKQWIKAGHDPHLWPGHTHSKPSFDAPLMYLDEFDLPVARIKAGRLAACPCCTPTTPKYGVGGKIAYYPEEHVIRLIGPKCFASLNKEAHTEAEAALRREKRVAKDTAYLVQSLPKLHEVAANVYAALLVARALTKFHEGLHSRLEMSGYRFPNEARTGELRVWVDAGEVRRAPDGTEYRAEVAELITYARLPGYRMLDPKSLGLVEPLEAIDKTLEDILYQLDPEVKDEDNDWTGAVAALDDAERNRLATRISRTVTRAQPLIETLREVRRFCEVVSMNTLRSWGLHPGNRLPLTFGTNGTSFRFGRSDHSAYVVQISEAIHGPLLGLEFWKATVAEDEIRALAA
jgi:hypothetical protein